MASRKDFGPDVREIIRKMKTGMTQKGAIEALEALVCEMNSNGLAWSREVADYNANSRPPGS